MEVEHMRVEIYEEVYMAKQEGLKVNYSEIARKYNCDPRTVKRYYEKVDALPFVRNERIIPKVTDGFEEIIREKFLVNNAPAIAIYNLLKDKGYKGSYTTIKNFTHKLKSEKIEEATIRFETNPGFQCQIDWKEKLKLISKSGVEFIINIFLSILGFSREKYVELTIDKTQPTLFRCLTNMFHFFGGVPRELLFDNMRTVVDRSRTQFEKVQFNEIFYSFSKDAGFIPKTCIAFRPQTKGKVETVARIMNRIKAYNREFETLDDLKEILKKIMNDINNQIQKTTGETPNNLFEKEKEHLKPEPNYSILEAYYSTKPMTRKVPKDSLITFQNNKYSVPPKYIGKVVTIQSDGSNLSIYYNDYFVCSHIISNKKINYVPEHYHELAKMVLKDESLIEDICESNLKIFDKL